MASKQTEYVLDELVCFLSNPLFQVPVLSFMESKCLIFDPSVEDSPGYVEIHKEYKQLIDLLLEGFRTDTGLTHDQIIKAMKDLNSKPDLRDMFQVLFEQVLATEDFAIFVRIMAQKNLELQQQALMLISQMMGGSLPESLMKETGGGSAVKEKGQQAEDQILLAVLAKSKDEYERQKKPSTEKAELQMIIGISHVENARLVESMKTEQEKLNETMKKSLSLNESPLPIIRTPAQQNTASKPTLSKSASIPPPAAYQPKRQSSTTSAAKPVVAKHNVQVGAGNSSVTSAQAAAAWMKSAETEVGSSDAHSRAVQAAAASMAGMSEEEYQKRAEFLKQQRDKLMDMKRKEREKQLLSAEKSQPQRPASARAARAALKQEDATGSSGPSAEEEKKLAMRRAIADRIKSELMDQAQK